MAKKLLVGCSTSLEKTLKQWAEENRPFPTEFLEKLKAGLLKRNLKAAALSLNPRRYWIRADRNEDGPAFYQEWLIESKGPPLARKYIYNFTRRMGMGYLSFLQRIELPLSEIVEIKNASLDVNLNYPQVGYQYDFYYCFLGELEAIKEKLRSDIQRQSNDIVRMALAPFERVTLIPTKTNEP